MAVHPVRVDRAKLFGALLADDLRDCITPFTHTRRAVREHLNRPGERKTFIKTVPVHKDKNDFPPLEYLHVELIMQQNFIVA